MNLSNENLIELSKFAIKAKKHIGLVKVKEMFTNQQYASDILVKATLSDNQEFAELTKKLSSKLNINVNVISSIETYINTLKAKGASNDSVWNWKYILVKLAQNLYGIQTDGESYRQTVEALILNVEIEERDFCINLVREFYPIWINENRSADEFNNEHANNMGMLKNEPMNKALLDLWNSIGLEFFSNTESWSLNRYEESMRQMGVVEKVIDIRQRIAKIITMELRNDNNNEKESYRNAIKRTQHLFSRQDVKEFFLIVSREFYYFWAGHPEAEKYLKCDELESVFSSTKTLLTP